MNGLILAAGVGSRLGETTKNFPKVLLPIGGQPLLDILIKKLLNIKLETIVVNTFFKADLVEEFILKQEYANKIIISREKKLLGTAGSLKANLRFLDRQDFLVMHGDNFFLDDLSTMAEFHRNDSTKSLMTMGTFVSKNPELCGVVLSGENQFIESFHEKVDPAPSNVANSAIYIFKKESSSIINSLSVEETDISINLIPKFIGISRTFPLSNFFIDIGTPEGYSSAQLSIKNRN